MLVERVVVLMSTFNGEKHLRTQLDSVLGQTHQDLRLVIRDDGSTDRTREILGDYAKGAPMFRSLWGKHRCRLKLL